MALLNIATRGVDKAVGSLVKVNVRRDDGHKMSPLAWDLDVAFTLEDADHELVERLMPGATATIEASRRSGRKETRTDKTARDDIRFTLLDPSDGPVTELASAVGVLRSLVLRVAGNVAVVTIRARMHLDADLLVGVVHRLGKDLVVQSEPVQVAMFESVDQVGDDHAPLTVVSGDVVVARMDGDDEVFGLVTDVDGDDLAVEDVDGEIYAVDVGEVRTVLRVALPDGVTMAATLRSYRSRAKRAKVRASWEHLIVALGRLSGSQGGVVLTPEVVELALGVAREHLDDVTGDQTEVGTPTGDDEPGAEL